MRDQELIDKCVKVFGTTDDPNNGLYLLPDGRMLNFKGKIHMDIYMCTGLPDPPPKGGRIRNFMARTGAIRLRRGWFDDDSNELNFDAMPDNPPTGAQLRTLGKLARDADSVWYDVSYPLDHPLFNRERCSLQGNLSPLGAIAKFREDVERCRAK